MLSIVNNCCYGWYHRQLDLSIAKSRAAVSNIPDDQCLCEGAIAVKDVPNSHFYHRNDMEMADVFNIFSRKMTDFLQEHLVDRL